MDETLTLILLSLAMLAGCYLAGSIPLAFSFSEEKLKLVTVMGAGLLVGTALAVIIPEGVHTLYESQHLHAAHSHVAVDLKADVPADDAAAAVDVHDHSHEVGTEMHTFIGIALVLGFIFMLLVDQLGGGHHHHHPSTDVESGLSGQPNRHKNTATLGLVVHAAADGVALGAAATTSQTHVEMIVFIAIMLHKAPAAFGLVSFLLHEGLDRNRIRKHLAAFAAAAPLLSLITYFCLSQQNKETLASVNGTGIAMLFSAGTFLYVATVHILPELAAMGTTRTVSADGSVVIKEQAGFTKLELLLLIIGAILPLFLSIGHHH